MVRRHTTSSAAKGRTITSLTCCPPVRRGLDYPAYHLGTQYYWNNITGGGVPPWFTFIKATPTAPNPAYPDASAAIASNAAAIGRPHDDLQSAVSAGFAQQGAKYAFSSPAEDPLKYNQTGQAPNPYSGIVPVLPDEQAFFAKGIRVSRTPISTRTPTPPRSARRSRARRCSATPAIRRRGSSEAARFASGTTHGPGGVDKPSEGLKRTLELPATWTDYLIQRDEYAGAAPKGSDNVSYFETEPAKPTTTNRITFACRSPIRALARPSTW